MSSGGRCPDDERDVDRCGQVLEEGAEGGDAHARPDQRHSVIGAHVMREGAVGAFDRHAGPGLECPDRPALVAEPLDGHPEVGRLGEGGQGVGVGVPPQLLGEEPPPEELAARDGQAIEPSPRADDREDPRRLLAHRRHPELMAQAAGDRSDEPEQDHHPGGRGPDGDPHRLGERVADERSAGGDLVGERQCQPEVGVEVDDPPGLVLEVLAEPA